MKKLSLAFSLLFCVVVIVGCGPKRPEGLPSLVSCVLTFQYEDGSPVDNAMVSLSSDEESLRQWSIAGSTDSHGVAKISTNGEFVGAPAGKYKVVIRKVELVPTDKNDEYGEPIMDTYNLIAEEFTNAGKTPHSLEVGTSAVSQTFEVTKVRTKVAASTHH
jgi:hypothetical protein